MTISIKVAIPTPKSNPNFKHAFPLYDQQGEDGVSLLEL